MPGRPAITGVFDRDNRVGGGSAELSKYISLFLFEEKQRVQ